MSKEKPSIIFQPIGYGDTTVVPWSQRVLQCVPHSWPVSTPLKAKGLWGAWASCEVHTVTPSGFVVQLILSASRIIVYHFSPLLIFTQQVVVVKGIETFMVGCNIFLLLNDKWYWFAEKVVNLQPSPTLLHRWMEPRLTGCTPGPETRKRQFGFWWDNPSRVTCKQVYAAPA